jgi:methyl coenzyme M reductase beta subunit
VAAGTPEVALAVAILGVEEAGREAEVAGREVEVAGRDVEAWGAVEDKAIAAEAP